MTPQNETEKLIEEATKLCEAATPGPWYHGFQDGSGVVSPNIADEGTGVISHEASRHESTTPCIVDDVWRHGDAEFIARARTLLPQLATALAAATTNEKSWADHVLIASGGHAKTPAEAMKFIGSLRDMLDVAKAETKAATQREARYQELLADIWLYIDWRWVTKQLTTDQKELFADAVDADLNRSGDPDPKSDRWWRDDAAALSPAKPTEKDDE